ncbi:MAG: carbamoyltransferase HypF [Acidobacteriota bacterium]
MRSRARIQITGIVQGVGFRPFIYQLATRSRLCGFVANNSSGVEIEVEGDEERIEDFIGEIKSNPPPLARITSITVDFIPLNSDSSFVIKESVVQEERTALISPDIAICSDCLRELFDPADRRYGYPFINCTNCGPRYTIIKDIPYERKFTSMDSFKMCPACQREYEDPTNRRFHAQPNACWECGPRVFLVDGKGTELDGGDPIRETISLLKKGAVIAIKGLGGFHLAVDATNDEAVLALRRRKLREEKPLAIMSADCRRAEEFAVIDPEERWLLESPQHPIVLVRKREGNRISPHVAPRNPCFGLLLPYTPLHHLILQGGFLALVMTSGNLSEEPICIDNKEALERLAGIADYFLLHNRDIYLRTDDSVLRLVEKKPLTVRRSRGYVPQPILLPMELKQVLACGAEAKNTICLTKGNQAFLSQHIGELENLESLSFFEESIVHLTRILQIEPELIAYDLHPDYLSTKYALSFQGKRLFGVQHHHAHIASCLAENGVEESVLGIALDGSGYGLDGRIWGGEVLVADLRRASRVGHFKYIPLPGGAAAIREPWRMALSYLYAAYGEEYQDLKLSLFSRIPERTRHIIIKMIEQEINSPLTSSCGRLFDAVAALVGLRDYIRFEGQAAMELEATISSEETGYYPISMEQEGELTIFSPLPMIKRIVEDIHQGEPPGVVSAKFHNSLVQLFADFCLKLREETGMEKVALSGGVFQNVYLLTHLTSRLEQLGFEVYTHSQVPPNDGGLALGQAVIASYGADQ